MKYLAIKLMVVLGVLVFSSLSFAEPYDTYGYIDTLINQTTANNAATFGTGEAGEEGWVQSILGSEYKLEYKYDSSTWSLVDTGVWAHALILDPDYFLLKTGNIEGGPESGDRDSLFLFENLEALNWAVVQLSDMGIESTNWGLISHISEFGGGTGTGVPEPGSLLLLGTGLLGLAAVGRRRMNG